MTVRPLRSVDTAPASLRVITGGDRPRSRRTFVWAFYTVAAVGAFLALIYLRTAVDESAFELSRLERQIEIEEARQHQLHLEKIRLESPGEIVPIAEQMLGMVLPEDVIPVTATRMAGRSPDSVVSAEDGPTEVGDSPSGRRSDTEANPADAGTLR